MEELEWDTADSFGTTSTDDSLPLLTVDGDNGAGMEWVVATVTGADSDSTPGPSFLPPPPPPPSSSAFLLWNRSGYGVTIGTRNGDRLVWNAPRAVHSASFVAGGGHYGAARVSTHGGRGGVGVSHGASAAQARGFGSPTATTTGRPRRCHASSMYAQRGLQSGGNGSRDS